MTQLIRNTPELDQKLNEKDSEIQDLKQRLEALEKIVLNQKLN